jgi:hypothetical protein
LDRKNATLLLEKLNQKYRLKNLQMNIAPAVLQNTPPYQRKSAGINTSVVKVDFESVTDEFAFAFMRDILTQFPPFLQLTEVNFTKTAAINENILSTIQQGDVPSHVKGDFQFNWVGMEVKKDEATPTP